DSPIQPLVRQSSGSQRGDFADRGRHRGRRENEVTLAMKRIAFALVLITAGLVMPASAAGTGPLTAQPPTAVQRKPGFFDYMTVDAQYRRLLAAHPGNDQLAIVDMDSGAVLAQVDLGSKAGGYGVAVDVRDGKYFVGTAADKVVDINRKNMVLQAD